MKCSCGKNAVVYLRYSGKKLCKLCFTNLLEKRVRKNIGTNKLINKNDSVGVALSGGKDSTVCLHILNELSKRLPITLSAITIDEGIANYRKRTIKRAKRYCKQLGIEHEIVTFKKEFGYSLDEIVKSEKRQKACTYCGVLRRRLLNITSKELEVDKLATGHNLDDEVQAILMNYIRGEVVRLARLGPITPVREGFTPRIKPLCVIPEKEVAQYALLNKLEVDLSECPYAQDSFRTKIREYINDLELSYPGSKFSILSGFEKLKGMLTIPWTKLEVCEKCGEPTAQKICKVCELLERL